MSAVGYLNVYVYSKENINGAMYAMYVCNVSTINIYNISKYSKYRARVHNVLRYLSVLVCVLY